MNGTCMMCGMVYLKTGCSNPKCPCYERREEEMAKRKPTTTKKSGNGSKKK